MTFLGPKIPKSTVFLLGVTLVLRGQKISPRNNEINLQVRNIQVMATWQFWASNGQRYHAQPAWSNHRFVSSLDTPKGKENCQAIQDFSDTLFGRFSACISRMTTQIWSKKTPRTLNPASLQTMKPQPVSREYVLIHLPPFPNQANLTGLGFSCDQKPTDHMFAKLQLD